MNHVQFKSVWENWGFTDSNFRYGLNQVPKHCQQMYISQLYFLFSGFSLTQARWPLELSIFWFSNSSQKRALLFLTERQHSKTTLIALTSVMPPPWIGSSGQNENICLSWDWRGGWYESTMWQTTLADSERGWLLPKVPCGPYKKDKWKQDRQKERMIMEWHRTWEFEGCSRSNSTANTIPHGEI